MALSVYDTLEQAVICCKTDIVFRGTGKQRVCLLLWIFDDTPQPTPSLMGRAYVGVFDQDSVYNAFEKSNVAMSVISTEHALFNDTP